MNQYCYCGNDPINYVDPSGHKAKWWQWLISGLEVAVGIACCFVPVLQGCGVALIGMGAGSMISGYLTEANRGTFTAGWWSGQIAGIFPFIPKLGWLAPALGAYAGSVTTDWIDFGWDGIDWSKAAWTSVIAWLLNIFPTMIGESAGSSKIKDPVVWLINAYNSLFTSTASSIVNAFWGNKQ